MKLPGSLMIVLLVSLDLLFAQPRSGESAVHADSLLQTAVVSYHEGAYAHAIDLLQPSGGTLRSPKANYYLGSSFAALNDPQNAIRYLRMAVDSSARDIFFLAHSQEELHDFRGAAASYSRFLTHAGSDAVYGDIVPYARKRLSQLRAGK
jgi:hypothetical protein